ncbi:MarR family transcriptional regulator [Leifsonia sp. F6_8S_P_1B]|uniref:MarR family transcriptional regulator n=1 Tax=Leifsonia williamsii TaxID=3035919 RepID=A0ABT8KFS7_9MICO|nr:MarR family transcriptional regulator [Leifsonia williamsii]MDN4616313.1 MarR family transcriptional regulator [Leifsonia williamsii]
MSTDAPQLPITRGAEFALLLLDGFTLMVDEVVAELKEAGHPGATANLEFALRAIAEGAGTASELGRSLGVSKQAAAKSIASLEQLGYVERQADPQDARRKRLVVTPRGVEMHRIGAEAFDRLKDRLATRLGDGRLRELEDGLRELAVELQRVQAPWRPV